MRISILRTRTDNRSQGHFRLRALATVALLSTAVVFVLTGLFATGTQDVTGTYMADDGAIYYVQQSGNVLWWAGMSLDSELPPEAQWHRGLKFTIIFQGTINSDGSVAVEWLDVTRG